MSYASAGIGTQHHVNAELLKTLTGIEMTHVPYRGGGPALQDVIAGHVPIYVRRRQHRHAAGARRQGEGAGAAPSRSGSTRSPRCRPCTRPAITNYNASAWQAFVAPAGTPPAIVARAEPGLARGREVTGDAEAVLRSSACGRSPARPTNSAPS